MASFVPSGGAAATGVSWCSGGRFSTSSGGGEGGNTAAAEDDDEEDDMPGADDNHRPADRSIAASPS